MSALAPNKLLTVPPVLEPYRFGLFSVAEIIDGDGKWEIGGVEWDTDACATGGYVKGMCSPHPARDHAKQHPEGINTVPGSDPFAAYVRAECNALGFEEAELIARRRLELVEPKTVEEYFSREVLGGDAYHLGRPLDDDAVALAYAVGVLEQWGETRYGGALTLHAPRWTSPYLGRVLQRTADTAPIQRTRLGSRVAFGAGYLDNPFDTTGVRDTEGAPGRQYGGRFWLFATGSVRIHRAGIRTYEAFQDTTNTRTVLAERPYAIDHDCLMAGVLVDMSEAVATR